MSRHDEQVKEFALCIFWIIAFCALIYVLFDLFAFDVEFQNKYENSFSQEELDVN